MKKNWTITQKSFDSLLSWLDEDAEQAGQKYQQIRERLIKIFISRGFLEAEDLADEVFNRVTSKIESLSANYSGERSYYFYGVASKLILEARRKKEIALVDSSVRAVEEDKSDKKMDCLDECLGKLPNRQHQLIMSYYEVEKNAKVTERINLAESLNLNLNALRVQVSRIRNTLKACIEECSA